jgi:hypothetical protein
MAFQTRDFLSILAGMINRMRATQAEITDFNIGGVARALLEAPAIEIEALYIEYVNGLLDAIPAAVYLGFSFDRLPAARAAGEVVFAGEEEREFAVTIPVGTEVAVPGTDKVYAVTRAGTLEPEDETLTLPVLATTPGVSGNALPGSVVELRGSINGLAGVTNPIARVRGLAITHCVIARPESYLADPARESTVEVG